MKTPAWLTELAARIDERDRRERILLAATVLVVLLVVWDTTLRAPLTARRADALDRSVRLEEQIASLRDSQRGLQSQIQQLGDGGAPARQRLRERVKRLDRELEKRTASMISPQQMVAALRDVVDDQEDVRIVRLENADAEPVMAAGDGGDSDQPAADMPRVYRHRVEVVVEGRYLDLLEYMNRLEALDWRFEWDGVRVETHDYPLARATLSLSTLSLVEDWIGV